MNRSASSRVVIVGLVFLVACRSAEQATEDGGGGPSPDATLATPTDLPNTPDAASAGDLAGSPDLALLSASDLADVDLTASPDQLPAADLLPQGDLLPPPPWVAVTSGIAGDRIYQAARAPSDADVIYIVGVSGFWKSTDRGATWHAANDGLGDLVPVAFAIDPSATATLYIISGDLKLARTTDGGAHWTRLSPTGLGGWLSTIVVHPTDPTILFIGSSAGILVSADSGATWSGTNGGDGISVFHITFDPNNVDNLLASTNGNGIYRSKNGGETWLASNTGLEATFLPRVVYDPAKSGVAYAASWGKGVYRSTDGGASWTQAAAGLGDLYVRRIAIDPKNSSRLLAGGNGSGVFLSTDSSATWTTTGVTEGVVSEILLDPAQTTHAIVTFEDGVGEHADLWGAGVTVSTDDFASVTPSNTGLTEVRVTDVRFAPSDPSILYASTNAGVLRSSNGGATWSATALPRVVEALAIDPTDADIVYAGVYKSTDGGASWNALSGPPYDADAIIIDPSTPSTIYAPSHQFGISRSTNGGSTWVKVNDGFGSIDGSKRFFGFAVDPQDGQKLWVGYGTSVWKSENGGTDWTITGSGLGNDEMRALAIDPNSSSTIYAADASHVYLTEDGGAHWQSTATGLPSAIDPASLSIDPVEPATIYLGTRAQSLWKTSDGAAHWVAANELLPASVLRVAVHPTMRTILFAATELGLFTSTTGGL